MLDRPPKLPPGHPDEGKSATERMIEFAATLKAGGAKKEENLEWRAWPVEKPMSRPVAVMASDPYVYGGAWSADRLLGRWISHPLPLKERLPS